MGNKITVILYYIASVLFYMVSASKVSIQAFTSAVVWLCLGSACLCFGASAQSKHKRSDDEDISNKK
ncbi:MAG: hypothetical protein ACLUL2_20430 [Blautia sp.]